jgi:MJ1316 RNA cyclic group end recognition domain
MDTSARDPNGFYLLGVSPSINFNQDKYTRKGSDIQASLLNCLRTFEGELRANSKYYDNIETFTGLSSIKQSQLPFKVIPDPFVWPDNGIDPPIDEDSDEEENVTPPLPTDLTSGVQEGEGLPTEEDWSEFQPISASKRKKAAAKSKTTPHIPAGKLRTSSDVFNRLMWDPSISKEEYVIGYEDRFLGIKEGSLASWKREVEDESFVSAEGSTTCLPRSPSFSRFLSIVSYISSAYLTGSTSGTGGKYLLLIL